MCAIRRKEANVFRKATVAVSIVLLLLSGVAAAERKVEDYAQTINMFKANPTVGPYMKSAYGYAVFPTIGKGGIGIGGAYGPGQVYRGGKVTGFTSLADISIGFQFGGQAYSQIVLFEDKSAYNNFTSGNFEFDASASAVAVTASAQAELGTTGTGASAGIGGSAGQQAKAPYRKGLLVFTIAKGGLMFEATIGGQKYSFTPIG